MGGTLPKPPNQRRRRNRSSTATVLYESGSVTIPDLPVENAHQHTLDYWADLWNSPVASEMSRVDAGGLLILITLVEAFWRADTVTQRIDLSREIRLVAATFGLTPVSRRGLQWSIANIVDAEARRAERAARPEAQRPDPRVKLPRPKDPRVHE